MSMLLVGEYSSLLDFGSRENWWMGQKCCRFLWDDTFAVWAQTAGWEVCRGMGRTWRAGLGREDQRRFHWKTWWPRGKNQAQHTSTTICPLVHPASVCRIRPGGQTSTDWIWFICALIICTLLRIFFWWPARVTPTLRMSLSSTCKHTRKEISAKHVVLLHKPPSPCQNKHTLSAPNEMASFQAWSPSAAVR